MNDKVCNLEVKVLNYMPNPIKTMWMAARNCYYKGSLSDLECTYDPKKAFDLVKNIYKLEHLSIYEMPTFQFGIEGVSRSLLAQLTRHRIGWSFAVQSQHFQKHNDFQYKDLEQYASEEHKEEYYKLMDSLNTFYKKSMELGIPRYIAREVLPNSCAVHLVAGTNLRALDNFWKLRASSNNTPEIIKLSDTLFEKTSSVFPELPEIIDYTKYKNKK